MTKTLGLALALGLVSGSAAASAQSAPMTLPQVLDYAAAHQPALLAAREDAAARDAGITVARGAEWPRLDAVWQSNA